MNYLVYLLFVASWMGGIVLAQGFWLTVLAVFLPFYAWYLIIERCMILGGFI